MNIFSQMQVEKIWGRESKKNPFNSIKYLQTFNLSILDYFEWKIK